MGKSLRHWRGAQRVDRPVLYYNRIARHDVCVHIAYRNNELLDTCGMTSFFPVKLTHHMPHTCIS